MKWTPLIAVLLLALLAAALAACGGCGAGYQTDLLTYDNIILAATESARGVGALDQAIQASDAKRKAAMLQALGESVVVIALQEGQTPEAAKAGADRIVAAMTTHLANYAEQDRRRRVLVETTVDNLAYIVEVAEAGKQFALYRADIGAQWKQYLDVVAKKRLAAAAVPAAAPSEGGAP